MENDVQNVEKADECSCAGVKTRDMIEQAMKEVKEAEKKSAYAGFMERWPTMNISVLPAVIFWFVIDSSKYMMRSTLRSTRNIS